MAQCAVSDDGEELDEFLGVERAVQIFNREGGAAAEEIQKNAGAIEDQRARADDGERSRGGVCSAGRLGHEWQDSAAVRPRVTGRSLPRAPGAGFTSLGRPV